MGYYRARGDSRAFNPWLAAAAALAMMAAALMSRS